MKTYINKLSAPIDGSSLAVFRILYGFIMAYGITEKFVKGGVYYTYLKHDFLFTYTFAQWIPSFNDAVMYLIYFIGIITAICFMLGYKFKITGLIFIITQSYYFLLETSSYLNHIYFAILLGLLLWIAPSHRVWSMDANHNRKTGKWPDDDRIPMWGRYILIIQMEIMLVYAGIVKITPEFYEGHTLRIWLTKYWIFSYEWQILLATFFGVAIHIACAPLLLFKKTRVYAFCAYVSFHTLNYILFPKIGIFPHLTIAATTIFLSPSWPRHVFYFFRKLSIKSFKLAETIKIKTPQWPQIKQGDSLPSSYFKMGGILTAFLVLWFLLQAIIPARHIFIPGNVHWDRNGYMFAWQMMLISRTVDHENSRFFICGEKPNEKTTCWPAHPRKQGDLSKYQYKAFTYMPDLVVQYAHHVEEQYRELGYEDIRFYGALRASSSGRIFQNLWDPDLDLTSIERSLWKDDFILPLVGELPERPPWNANVRGTLESNFGYHVKHTEGENNDSCSSCPDCFQDYPEEVLDYAAGR